MLALLTSALATSMATAAPRSGSSCPNRSDEQWYRIIGRPETDGCGGRIVLAARNLRLGADTLFADVVDRTYRLGRHGDQLEAFGRFATPYSCPSTEIEERWELRQVDSDTLEGSLSSTWQLPPRCEACTITFRVRAIRAHGRTRRGD